MTGKAKVQQLKKSTFEDYSLHTERYLMVNYLVSSTRPCKLHLWRNPSMPSIPLARIKRLKSRRRGHIYNYILPKAKKKKRKKVNSQIHDNTFHTINKSFVLLKQGVCFNSACKKNEEATEKPNNMVAKKTWQFQIQKNHYFLMKLSKLIENVVMIQKEGIISFFLYFSIFQDIMKAAKLEECNGKNIFLLSSLSFLFLPIQKKVP